MTIATDDRVLAFNQYHDDAEGRFRFIVRKLDGLIIIEIKVGNKLAQRCVIRYGELSEYVGSDENGILIEKQPYLIDLDPEKPIFPVGGLVDQLVAMGVLPWKISPCFRAILRESASRHAEPQMATDGTTTVQSTLVELNAERIVFEVSNARWAVFHDGRRIHHIWLWPNAADDAARIIETITKIWAGELASDA